MRLRLDLPISSDRYDHNYTKDKNIVPKKIKLFSFVYEI